MNSKDLLLIFTRNPELGKCKTRLAATLGNETALDIYKFLLKYTANITKQLSADKETWYSEEIWKNDVWPSSTFRKKLQEGINLGERMTHAFKKGFEHGYERIIIIGSDLYDLNTEDLNRAFKNLACHDYVIGPAEDGGYYLLGMTKYTPELFQNKKWGTDSVLTDTLKDLKNKDYVRLDTRNDIDVFEDIKDHPAFLPFLKTAK